MLWLGGELEVGWRSQPLTKVFLIFGSKQFQDLLARGDSDLV
jgi:hypothetical protein